MKPHTPAVAAVARFLMAALFLASGFGKIAAPAATRAAIASVGLPLPALGYVLAIAVEVGGGILLVLGIQSRLVALVMAVFTVATALAFHHDFADQNQLAHFLKNLAIVGGLLQVVAFGAGAYSLAGRWARAGTRAAMP